jgi:hypothetical protein
MLKSDPRDFNPFSGISVQLKKCFAELLKPIGKKPILSVSLLSVLSFGGISWLTLAAIAPQSAQAYTANVSVSLNRQPNENFQSFMRRAESVARAAAQRSFDRDILVTDVAVTVLGQNDGAIVPLLSLKVSRQAWKSRPDPQRWASYFPNTQLLLGIKDPDNRPRTDPDDGPEPGARPQPGATPQPGANPQQPPTRVITLPGAPNQIILPGTTQNAPAQPAPGTPVQITPGTPQGTSEQTTPGTPQGTPSQAAPSTPQGTTVPFGTGSPLPAPPSVP